MGSLHPKDGQSEQREKVWFKLLLGQVPSDARRLDGVEQATGARSGRPGHATAKVCLGRWAVVSTEQGPMGALGLAR